MNPKITIDQWRALIAVVEAGGYAQAAARLHKTQSSVSYAIQQIQRLLNVEIFRIEGRKAKLTTTGEVLYRRARELLEEAEGLETAAGRLAAGWEAQLRIAAEILFPSWLLLNCFAEFAQEQPNMRIELIESVLGGTDEALLDSRVDLAIVHFIPQGFMGELLMRLNCDYFAHPEHPLHQLGRPLTNADLGRHRQILIRDSGLRRKRESGAWLGAEQRWTVSNMATSIAAVAMGQGFAMYPEDMVRNELERGLLKPLPLREGSLRNIDLYLVFGDRDYAGPGALRLAEILRTRVAAECKSLRSQRAAAAGGNDLASAVPDRSHVLQ